MVATDEELVARSMAGDVDSFNQLVLRWERPIYALAYRVIGRDAGPAAVMASVEWSSACPDSAVAMARG